MRNFCLHLGIGANAAGLPFRKTRVSSESVAITRISFIETGLFPPQLLSEIAKEAEHSPSGWSGHHHRVRQEAKTYWGGVLAAPLNLGRGRVGWGFAGDKHFFLSPMPPLIV